MIPQQDDFDGSDGVFGETKARRESYYMKKALGQHFLRDRDFARRIAEALPKDSHIVEIGPGDGSLTQELVTSGHAVTAIEVDADLIPRLKKRFHRDQFSVIPADVLRINWEALASEKGELTLAGNLPYNIATTLLGRLFEAMRRKDPPPIRLMVFTFQKEVAERLTAASGNRTYGAMTLLTNYHCRTEYLFTIPADRFFPKPQVDAGVVLFTALTEAERPALPYEFFKRVVRSCFAQRRKQMRNSIRVMNDLPDGYEQLPYEWLKRPEQFDFLEFVSLAKDLQRLGFKAG